MDKKQRLSRIKLIVTSVVIVVLAAATGCSAQSNDPIDISENDSEINNSIIESVFSENSILSQPDILQPINSRLEVSDEIKNAALNSGLVQLNNDVFQRGGYVTVADFVNKYKDRYNITFSYYQDFRRTGAYDDCRDYPIEYDFKKYIFISISGLGRRWWEGYELFEDNSWDNYYLTLIPKDGYNTAPVKAYVVNAVSPDAAITLDNAVIAEVEPICYDDVFTTPEWIPMGFNSEEFKDFESENHKYTAKEIIDILEANGLEKKHF